MSKPSDEAQVLEALKELVKSDKLKKEERELLQDKLDALSTIKRTKKDYKIYAYNAETKMPDTNVVEENVDGERLYIAALVIIAFPMRKKEKEEEGKLEGNGLKALNRMVYGAEYEDGPGEDAKVAVAGVRKVTNHFRDFQCFRQYTKDHVEPPSEDKPLAEPFFSGLKQAFGLVTHADEIGSAADALPSKPKSKTREFT